MWESSGQGLSNVVEAVKLHSTFLLKRMYQKSEISFSSVDAIFYQSHHHQIDTHFILLMTDDSESIRKLGPYKDLGYLRYVRITMDMHGYIIYRLVLPGNSSEREVLGAKRHFIYFPDFPDFPDF